MSAVVVLRPGVEPMLVWQENGKFFFQRGLRGAALEVTKGGDTLELKARALVDHQPCEIRSVPHGPARRHPRIFRELIPSPDISADERSAALALGRSLRSLFRDLEELFLAIEPDPSNQGAFGSRVRQFLILACTEVEASFRGVLAANHIVLQRPAMSDYVKLLGAMRLDEWRFRLRIHPSYPEISPFCGWDAARPTQSLAWYDSYNAVKHNREENLPRATLGQAISAGAALLAVALAQFGYQFSQVTRFDGEPFEAVGNPTWQPEECYWLAGKIRHELVDYQI